MQFVIHRNALKAVSRFMAVKDVRYYLNGILIESNDMQTRMVATDGHTLIVHRSDAKDENEGSWQGIMPDTFVKTLLGWKPEGKWQKDQPILCVIRDGEIRAQWGANIAVCKPIDGKFPDYRRVIPETCSGMASFYDPDYLARVKRASEDLGSNKGFFELKMNGKTAPNESEGAGVAVINANCFAIIMPMRQDVADLCATNWARDSLPELPPVAQEEIAA